MKCMDLIQVDLDGFWKFSLYKGLCRISFLSSFWGKPWMHYLSLSRTTFDNLWWQAHTELCEEADTMAAKIRTAMYSQKQQEFLEEYEVYEVLSRWAVCQPSIFDFGPAKPKSGWNMLKPSAALRSLANFLTSKRSQCTRCSLAASIANHCEAFSQPCSAKHSRTKDQLRTRESWGLSTLNISKFKLSSYDLWYLNVFWVEICLICGKSVPFDHALIL